MIDTLILILLALLILIVITIVTRKVSTSNKISGTDKIVDAEIIGYDTQHCDGDGGYLLLIVKYVNDGKEVIVVGQTPLLTYSYKIGDKIRLKIYKRKQKLNNIEIKINTETFKLTPKTEKVKVDPEITFDLNDSKKYNDLIIAALLVGVLIILLKLFL